MVWSISIMELFAMDSAVKSFLEQVWRSWRNHQPTQASLWGPLIIDHFEDLSDKGLEAWSQKLLSLEADLGTIQGESHTFLEQAILGEIRRFINEQKFRITPENPYKLRAKPYLQLVALSLLPFHLFPQLRQAPDIVESKITACSKLLEEGTKRLYSGSILTTEADRKLASQLHNEISGLFGDPSEPTTDLLTKLENWSQLPIFNPTRPMNRVSLRWYLETILQTRQPFLHLHDLFLERLRTEVLALNRALKLERKPVTTYLTSKFPTTKHDSENNEKYNFNSGLDWIRWIESCLLQSVEGKTLRHV